jgi:hypothetical protein
MRGVHAKGSGRRLEIQVTIEGNRSARRRRMSGETNVSGRVSADREISRADLALMV